MVRRQSTTEASPPALSHCLPWRLAPSWGLPVWMWPLLIPLSLLLLMGAPVAWVFWGLRRAFWWAGLTLTWPVRQTAAYRYMRELATKDILPSFRSQTVPEPVDLLPRVRLVRRLLVMFLAVQWCGLLALGFAAGTGCVWPSTRWCGPAAAISAMLTICVGFPAVFASYQHNRLRKAWVARQEYLCDTCGFNRRHSFVRCPECGSLRCPLPPGIEPLTWHAWTPLTLPGRAETPFALIGTVGLGLGIATNWVSHRLVGAVVLALTLSLAVIALSAVIRTAANLSKLRHLSSPPPSLSRTSRD